MKKKTKLIIAVPVIVILVLLVSVSSIYNKGPWRGKVVDAETGEPIGGAAVVARWDYETVGPTGGATNFLDARETVTNKDGEFVLPRKWFISIPFVRNVRGPWFTIFKPGYGSYPRYQVSPTHLSETLFEGKGTVVELPKLITKQERLEKLPHASDSFTNNNSKKKELIKLLNIERVDLGLQPYKGEGNHE